MSKDQKEACMYCKFWRCEDRNPPEGMLDYLGGACRVNPPTVMQVGSQSTDFYPKTCWPITKGGDWCGSFSMPRDDYSDIRPWRHISEISVEVAK